jgi:HD-GYP domain-containing protein (c-di-GMP phosphodiesterase class II)
MAIGSELKLSSEEMNELSLLAILHDIGKVGIHQGVLQKPGPLSSVEWEEMKRHPEIGYRIAQNTPELTVVAKYILSHHERWDGNGYPRRLKEREHPLAVPHHLGGRRIRRDDQRQGIQKGNQQKRGYEGTGG